MRKGILVLLSGLFSSMVSGQDITGHWSGVLAVQGKQLRVGFTISKTDSEYSSTMDSPDQGAKRVPVTTTSFENLLLKLIISNARIEYAGTLGKDNRIVGTFKQGSYIFPLNLSKETVEKETLVRLQEPVKPYSYISEDITFENKKAKITLAGTLTLPNKEGIFPGVVLISGSGPQNRDEEGFGHKTFLVLADYLTKNGIAVLRFDDRGTAFSQGEFITATSLDFATDVEAGVQYLKTRKEINQKQIGLVGHSEGGIIAPMVASSATYIAFIILLAGAGIPGDQLLLLQQEVISKRSGVSNENLQLSNKIHAEAFEIVKQSKKTEQLKIALTNYFQQMQNNHPGLFPIRGMSEEKYIQLQVNRLISPWMQYFIKYDPATALKKVKCPVLAINGRKDVQVPSKENLEAIKQALIQGGNKKITIQELPALNHLFQECTTGLPDEYPQIEQTFAPTALKEILEWILTQTK